MFEFSQLRCFVAVAEDLHFSRAALRLNMTQPPLSRQIQLLERALGVTLLERTSRTVRMTSAGRVFRMGIALVPEAARNLLVRGVALRELRPAPEAQAELHLVWRRGQDNPAFRSFRSLVLPKLTQG